MARLDEQIRKAGATCHEVWHTPAYSAPRRAKYMRESGKRVAKAVLVVTDRCPIIALIPSTCRLAFDSLKRLLGFADARLATARDLSHLLPQCEYGTVPGFGRPYHLATVIDERLLREPYFVVPGDRSHADYRLTPSDYQNLEHPLAGNISEPMVSAESHVSKSNVNSERRPRGGRRT